MLTRPYFRKKGQDLLREKRVHFFHWQGKKELFFHFQGTHFFPATLMLMHETPKIGPVNICSPPVSLGYCLYFRTPLTITNLYFERATSE